VVSDAGGGRFVRIVGSRRSHAIWCARVVAAWLVVLALVAAAPSGSRSVILATTTSTQDSGLLDTLVPMFERQTGYTVKTIAVGTGQALTMGARGEADVVLVHAPKIETTYVERGDLINRRLVMHNDFVIAGPSADPAGARRAKTTVDAMKAIATKEAPFVSRGDNSGTHAKERALWKAAGVTPAGVWYVESGQGMGATLTIASERQAYTLTDRATYLAFKKRVDLAILLEGDAPLLNVYHVLEINVAKHPKINAAGGKAFADFLVSTEAQSAIRTFGVPSYGQPLFFPDAGKAEPAAGD
jgi:tungstate transport system substrate-binding protein